jgi:recombinational DNA repair protein (RecF pathway)
MTTTKNQTPAQTTVTNECALCGRHGQMYPDRGRRICEKCLLAGVEDHAQYMLEITPVSVKAR